MSCAHVIDSALVDFYDRHPELMCARCWLDLAGPPPPGPVRTSERLQDPATPLFQLGGRP